MFLYSFMITLIFFFMLSINTPILMILLLILLTLIMSFLLTLSFNLSWLAMMIFLMMIGGLLILFIYMISISPNKKSTIKMKYLPSKLFMILMISLMLTFTLPMNPMMSPLMIFPMLNHTILMIFSTLYLLFLLFMITLIIKKKEGPLRSF